MQRRLRFSVMWVYPKSGSYLDMSSRSSAYTPGYLTDQKDGEPDGSFMFRPKMKDMQ